MESHPSVTDRPVRIPPIAWFLGVGLIVALVAIFFFNVAINTVAYYGFLALMIGSHFFMHGGHGGTSQAWLRTLTKRIKMNVPVIPVVATRGSTRVPSSVYFHKELFPCYSKILFVASVFNAVRLISLSRSKA